MSLHKIEYFQFIAILIGLNLNQINKLNMQNTIKITMRNFIKNAGNRKSSYFELTIKDCINAI